MIFIAHQNGFIDLLHYIKKYQIKTWAYLGEDTRWRILADQKFSRWAERISIAEQLNEESWQERSSYIEGIGSLSAINDSYEWWISEISSKDPYNPLFLRFCLVNIGKKLLDSPVDSNFLIIASSPTVISVLLEYADVKGKEIRFLDNRNFIKKMVNRIRSGSIQMIRQIPPIPMIKPLSETYSHYLEGHLIYRKQILKERQIKPLAPFSGGDSILFFTYVDMRNFDSDNGYKDPHFGPLPALLKRKGYSVAFVPRILDTITFDIAVDKLVNTGEVFFFPESFFETTDVNVSNQRAIGYKPDIPQSFSIGGVPAKSLLEENLAESCHTMADNILYNVLLSRMQGRGIEPGKIIYTFEGQSWENSLVYSIRKTFPQTKVIAYDNVTFSKMFLSKFHSRQEMQIRPLPDQIVTNGRLFYDVLISEGYPSEKISSGCALRHSYMWNNQKEQHPYPEERHRWNILVATSAGYGESLELVQKACDAFTEDDKIDIIVKCHPLIDRAVFINDLKADIRPHISFSDEPVETLLDKADILLYTTTSVCYEALRFGVMPICVHLENFITLDRLDIIPDIRWIAATPVQIKDTVQTIKEMSEEKQREWAKKALTAVKDALSPVDEHCADYFT